MNYEAWRFWVDVFQWLITAVAGIYLYVSTRTKATSDNLQQMGKDMRGEIAAVNKEIGGKVECHSDRLTEIETGIEKTPDLQPDLKEADRRLRSVSARLGKVEAACKTAPNHKDLSAVYEKVNDVSNQVSGLAEGMKSLVGRVDMIFDHLMNKGDKG